MLSKIMSLVGALCLCSTASATNFVPLSFVTAQSVAVVPQVVQTVAVPQVVSFAHAPVVQQVAVKQVAQQVRVVKQVQQVQRVRVRTVCRAGAFGFRRCR